MRLFCRMKLHSFENVFPDKIHEYLKCKFCGFERVKLGNHFEEIPQGWMDAAKAAVSNWPYYPNAYVHSRPPPLTRPPTPRKVKVTVR